MPSLNLQVTLDEAPRPVTRVIDIPAETTLHGLHLIVQAAFGWADAHLHLFSKGERIWCPARLPDTSNEAGVLVSDLLTQVGDTMTYTYDFGDQWNHTITLVGTDNRARKKATLKSATGLTPMEDIGGIEAWAEILEDIDLAAEGRWEELHDRERYRLIFRNEHASIIKHWADKAHEKYFREDINAVKKADPTAEPNPDDYPDFGEDSFDKALDTSLLLARGLMDMGYSAQDAVDVINEKIATFHLDMKPLTSEDLANANFDAYEQPAQAGSVSIGNPISAAKGAGLISTSQGGGEDDDDDFDLYESGWYDALIKEPTPFDGDTIPQRLYERAQQRGVLRAVGDYFGLSLLNEMIAMQEESSAHFNDTHAELFGTKIQAVYAIMLNDEPREAKERALATLLGQPLAVGDAIHNEFEYLFLTIEFLAWTGEELIPVPETRRLLECDPATFAREVARRMPAERGEHFITSIIALLTLAYGEEAARALGQLRDHDPMMETAEFYQGLARLYFPHLDPEVVELGPLQEIFRRFGGVRDSLLEMYPFIPNPLFPEQQTPHPTLVAFVKESLSHLDPQHLLTEAQEGYRDHSR